MEGPRPPAENEWTSVVDFLNRKLRADSQWSIDSEYPTALTPSNIHNIRIIKSDSQIVSHAVMKPLIIKSPKIIYKVGAIGSVVTDPDHRNQGHSSTLLKDCLEAAKNQQCDFAILWTGLHDFYRKMGFELAGSEISLVIDKPLGAEATDLRFSEDPRVSPEALFRLYSNHTVSTVRTLEEVRKYMSIPQTKIYTAWDKNGTLAAFAIEGKGADLTGYIHEWGGNVSRLMALFDYIYSLKKSSFTVIVPEHSAHLIHQLMQKGASMNQGFLGMIRIVNHEQFFNKIKRAFRNEGVQDIVLEKAKDHFLFGIGKDLFTLNDEADLVRLMFGPIDLQRLDILGERTRLQLSKIFPLPFWIWGWDSV